MFTSRVRLTCLILTVLLLPHMAYAEPMSDLIIQNMYNKLASDMDNPTSTNINLTFRLAPTYTLKTQLTTIVGKDAPVVTDVTKDKKQVLADMAVSYKMSTTFKYENKITAIQYSLDRQLAYVSYTTVRTGMMTVTKADGGMTSKQFETASGCVDTMGLVNSSVTISMSECQTRTIIGE